MPYRRKGKNIALKNDEWAEWLKENADLIEASGIPNLIFSDKEHWLDFLDHGILDHHYDPLDFEVDQLSIKQKAALLRLLMKYEMYLTTVVGRSLIYSLLDAVENFYKD